MQLIKHLFKPSIKIFTEWIEWNTESDKIWYISNFGCLQKKNFYFWSSLYFNLLFQKTITNVNRTQLKLTSRYCIHFLCVCPLHVFRLLSYANKNLDTRYENRFSLGSNFKISFAEHEQLKSWKTIQETNVWTSFISLWGEIPPP